MKPLALLLFLPACAISSADIACSTVCDYYRGRMSAALPVGSRACRCVDPSPDRPLPILDTGESQAETVSCIGPCEDEARAIIARQPWRRARW